MSEIFHFKTLKKEIKSNIFDILDILNKYYYSQEWYIKEYDYHDGLHIFSYDAERQYVFYSLKDLRKWVAKEIWETERVI